MTDLPDASSLVALDSDPVRAELGVSVVRLVAELSRRSRHEHKALRRTEDFEALREATSALRRALGLTAKSPELDRLPADERGQQSGNRSVEQRIERWVASDVDDALDAVAGGALESSGAALLLGAVCTYQALERWARPPCAEACVPPPVSVFADTRRAIAKALGMAEPECRELVTDTDRAVERLLMETPALLRIQVRELAARSRDPRR